LGVVQCTECKGQLAGQLEAIVAVLDFGTRDQRIGNQQPNSKAGNLLWCKDFARKRALGKSGVGGGLARSRGWTAEKECRHQRQDNHYGRQKTVHEVYYLGLWMSLLGATVCPIAKSNRV
jgi:hypothetical protein